MVVIMVSVIILCRRNLQNKQHLHNKRSLELSKVLNQSADSFWREPRMVLLMWGEDQKLKSGQLFLFSHTVTQLCLRRGSLLFRNLPLFLSFMLLFLRKNSKNSRYKWDLNRTWPTVRQFWGIWVWKGKTQCFSWVWQTLYDNIDSIKVPNPLRICF